MRAHILQETGARFDASHHRLQRQTRNERASMNEDPVKVAMQGLYHVHRRESLDGVLVIRVKFRPDELESWLQGSVCVGLVADLYA